MYWHYDIRISTKKVTKREIRATRRQWRHSTCLPYTGGMQSQNRHDRHTMTVSRFRLLEVNSPRDEHKTKEARDERIEKRSCEIELRGEHLKPVYYNGKQVLLCIKQATCHCSPACEDRRRNH